MESLNFTTKNVTTNLKEKFYRYVSHLTLSAGITYHVSKGEKILTNITNSIEKCTCRQKLISDNIASLNPIILKLDPFRNFRSENLEVDPIRDEF